LEPDATIPLLHFPLGVVEGGLEDFADSGLVYDYPAEQGFLRESLLALSDDFGRFSGKKLCD
jgi:hypothetical protein